MVHNSFSLKHMVEVLHRRAKPRGLCIADVFEVFGTLSQSVVVLLMCVPFVQPVPLLGLSTPAGMVMMAMGASLAMGIRRPWLPKKILNRHIEFETVDKVCTALEKVLEKTERFIKPRYGSWVELPIVRVLNGILILIFAFLLALPLPVPFSNMVPAYFLILNAAGWLERDGLVLLISYVIAIFAFAFFVGLTHGTAELIQHFWN
ncbi:MAG: exopolysaccharide biosynthesis protein [Bdellovibrionaceae bacterium]|nr:exopolysaccharide biosynthesis protein [Pseudobdellovibrionaceae bacterium]